MSLVPGGSRKRGQREKSNLENVSFRKREIEP